MTFCPRCGDPWTDHGGVEEPICREPTTAGTVARANGWRGFDSIGERVDGGYLYGCDGMPTQMGCGAQIIVPRRLSRVGRKSTGWLVCYGQDFDGTDIQDVLLTFCPKCALVVSGAA